MLRTISYALAVTGLMACLAAPAFAQDQYRTRETGSSMSSSEMTYGSHHHNGWSRAYRLTPLDQKRLRAMGLTNKEVYIIANVARETGRDPDDIAQMIFRGATVASLSEEFNLSPKVVETPRPEWTTPEWDQAVERGSSWPMTMSGDHGMGSGDREMRRERRERPSSESGGTGR
jgi:hypothetical protein